jgi:pimeloyl-ACP methyl ester carboxylesterase
VEERRIPVAEGVSLHVRVWPGLGSGSAAPFLLVHGLASNARMWDGVASLLSDAGHAVAAVDLRGHGRSDKPEEGYDFASIVRDLAAVLDALGYERPVVAGQSWGGNVVVELAAAVGDRLRGVACVDGGWMTFSHFESWEAMRDRLTPPALEGRLLAEIERGFRSAHPDWPETGIQGALACFEVRPDGTVAPWLSRDRHLAILRAMWDQDLPAALSQVTVPVLLLPCDDGGGGAWIDHKRAEVAAAEMELAQATTHWFQADHDVHAQHPDAVAARLLDWLPS